MNNAVEIKKIAKRCIDIESSAINSLYERINDDFVNIVELLLNIKGRLIITAIGKSANIASKMVATLNSTGQPSIFLHAGTDLYRDQIFLKEKLLYADLIFTECDFNIRYIEKMYPELNKS